VGLQRHFRTPSVKRSPKIFPFRRVTDTGYALRPDDFKIPNTFHQYIRDELLNFFGTNARLCQTFDTPRPVPATSVVSIFVEHCGFIGVLLSHRAQVHRLATGGTGRNIQQHARPCHASPRTVLGQNLLESIPLRDADQRISPLRIDRYTALASYCLKRVLAQERTGTQYLADIHLSPRLAALRRRDSALLEV
jgi:hypothetical protein